jgi:hypothetical protein
MGELSMKVGLIVPACAATLYQSPAFGEGQLTEALAAILSSEQYCGLSYSQDAIQAFISKNIAPSDTRFLSDLEFDRRTEEIQHEKFGPSERTAYCTHVKQMAEYFGFLKN